MKTYAWALSLLGLLTACRSPVLSEGREELGPELPDVEEGEFHRPGQPCLRCHDSRGGEEPTMVVAGTVFATPDQKIPVAGVTVTITDATGQSPPGAVTTNCVGNFYITADEWQPAFPLNAAIICPPSASGGELPAQSMSSRIHRDGACAGCHEGLPSTESPGWVYCADVMPDPPYVADDSCPGRVPE